MKTKLSILSLAILPCLAAAQVTTIAAEPSARASQDSLLVMYKKGTSVAMRSQARSLVKAKVSDLNKDGVDDNYSSILSGRLAKFEVTGMSTKQAIKLLQTHAAVEYVEPDYRVSIATAPNDPDFSKLWGLHNEGQSGGTADADIDALEAWSITTGGKDVVVGVIDTGVDHSHSDLTANMWINPNEIAGDGIDNDGNGYIDDVHGINAITNVGDPMDDQGHGTHVSGTIGAAGNNNNGVVGVNHEAAIVGCKFLDASGSGSTSDAIKCIDYMVSLKNAGVNVRVLNNSWGGGGFSQALADAITASEQADILFVAAAGNDAVDNDQNPHYPSNYEHESVLSVASTDRNDNMSDFSQWGLTSVDLGAPGSAILSTVPGNGYATYSGTSMATPHVAGVAALVLSLNPDLSTSELKQLLMDSGDDNAQLAGKTVSGKRLNANQALEQADPTPSFKLSVTPTAQQITAGETATYTFEIGSIAQWQGVVDLELIGDLAGASLSANTATPGDVVILSVPTQESTQWGRYDFSVNASSGELAKQKSVSLLVDPVGLNDFTYTNDTAVAIPDNNVDGVDSVITVNDPLTVFATQASIDISHTYIGDLIVTLTSPRGTSSTLHSQSGGSAEDIVQSYSLADFNGEVATGDWVLHVEDTYAADTGTLNNWSLTFSAIGEVTPQPPQADFDYDAQALTVSFTDSSSDANNDITQWSWDFGDGATSTDANPVHAYAQSGNYQVTLTVTDSEGNTDSSVQTVVVSDVAIALSLTRANKTRLNTMRVDLSWEQVGAQSLNVYRNGEFVGTTTDNGRHRDFLRNATLPAYDYQVCVTADVCSNIVTVTFE
ncbi:MULTISPECIES: S8 family serine peptidase [Pseudoalteromonas]|uniref:S8 family serine peptidase n=1 Tax=Pseudoalteromonas TaxID=53246 RepID=UPI0016034BFC|nr:MULTISPECIES: S8 family serine peptidase [Pseudoalteromonas]MBB1291460.1 S8 family serine peptidase [Pseudoalteromonas sp. SR41-4]MBB1308062.1 S8 family serine peptidase [Pseudoalteromonas sp. SR41-8]MBB1407881.1 S8 family serine peptidase [Pseudoalteromonas sp. SG44-17]|tara:strand:- start:2797 stop:5298 length:2502 start_codon:yes stop_codon:yes gene_type:complete